MTEPIKIWMPGDSFRPYQAKRLWMLSEREFAECERQVHEERKRRRQQLETARRLAVQYPNLIDGSDLYREQQEAG